MSKLTVNERLQIHKETMDDGGLKFQTNDYISRAVVITENKVIEKVIALLDKEIIVYEERMDDIKKDYKHYAKKRLPPNDSFDIILRQNQWLIIALQSLRAKITGDGK